MDSTRRLVERRENSLHSLFELSHALGVRLDPYAIAQLTLFNLMGHFGTTAAALWLIPEGSSGGAAVLIRGFGIPEEAARALGATLGVPGARNAREYGLALLATIPVQERVAGFVGLGPRLGDEPYGSLDLEHLSAAAGMVGVALENARLYHRARETNRQLRESNARLAELDRLKSEFLSNVNHELRTPLAVARGYLDILETQIEGAQQKEALDVANKHVRKLGSLIENLLAFSHLQEHALALKVEPQAVGELLTGFMEERSPGIADGLHELALEVEAGLPPVLCDTRRLLEVVGELVENAAKFTPPGSRIRIVARRAGGGDRVAIEIHDDGPGIEADRLQKLFEAFRQGDGSTTREAGGMGLGLALARRLTEAMGGDLVARSEPGVGSCFVMTLQRADAESGNA